MSTTFLTGVDDGGPALGQSWGSSEMGVSGASSVAWTGPGPLPTLDESRREDWVRLQAEKNTAHKVVPKSGLAVSTPIYFGTRRCTLSDVLCIVTTTELLAPTALDRDLALLAARTTPSGVATGEGSAVSSVADPRFASPLYPVRDLSSDERLRRNKALWKEQHTFMTALKAQRKLRIDAEDRGAAALQRMWRGFQLRRWLKTQAKKMKTRKRMKRSYAKIALKIRMQKEMEDNLRKAEQRREDAADLIAATFRMFVGYACSIKERKMRSDEVRRWGATMIQSMVRQRAARRRLVRRRMREREHRLRQAAVRFQSVWRRHAAVRRVHGVRLRLERVAAVWVQRWYRRRTAIKVTSALRAKALSNKLSTSALVVQRHWRGIQGRRKAYFKQHAVEAELLEAAALAVQCAFRGLMARTRVGRRRHRRQFQDRLRASVRIQTFARSRAGRELYQDEIDRQESDIWIQIKLGNVVAVEDLFKGFGTSEVYTSESTDEDGNTILCAAAKWGHKRLIRRGLKWMCDINHYNDDGLTAVELAVVNEHEKCAEYLIDHEAEVTKFGRTLLHEAAARDMPSVAESLLARNVPAHSEDTDSRTPLHEACAAASDKIVRTLIDRGAALDVQCVSTGRTPIHEAALSGDKAPSQRIVTMLMDAGARIDIKDTQGKTPWRAALTQNNQAVAKILRKSMRGKFDKEETSLKAQSSGISKEDQQAAIKLARDGDLPGLEDKLDHGLPVNLQLSETGESLLMGASSSGNFKLVEMLLRKGAKADLEDLRGRNAIHYGPSYGKIGITLASRGASLVNADAETGDTAMHLCAQNGHVFDEIMRSVRISPDLRDRTGRTPLHVAASKGRVEACRKLMALGADSSLVVDSGNPDNVNEGKTAIHLAASTIHGTDALRELLQAQGVSDLLTLQDAQGRLPLHDAALSGSAGNVLAICEATGGHLGANDIDNNGRSPLHLAAAGGKLGAVRALISKGGEPSMAEFGGMQLDSLGIALEAGREAFGVVTFLIKRKKMLEKSTLATYKWGQSDFSPMHMAARGGDEDCLKLFLELSGTKNGTRAQGILLNMRDKRGRPPLMHAVERGHSKFVAALLKAAADPLHAEMFDPKRGHNCLHAACALKSPYSLKAPELVETLVNDAGYGITVPDAAGNTCLHLAAEAGNVRLIKKLLDMGSDVRVVNKEGRTPLHSAAAFGHGESVTTLINGVSSPQSFAALQDTQGNTAVQLASHFGHDAIVQILSAV